MDGVLNRCGKSGQGLESDKVARLQRIVDACDPAIVVSSTWRLHEWPMERLHKLFRDMGARFGGATPFVQEKSDGGMYYGVARGREIQQWIDKHGRPERFAILDDDDSDMDALRSHLFKTESFVGLTDEITEQVVAALSSNSPK